MASENGCQNANPELHRPAPSTLSYTAQVVLDVPVTYTWQLKLYSGAGFDSQQLLIYFLFNSLVNN